MLRRLSAFALTWLLAGPSHAYDAAPLLESLRPAERERAVTQAQLGAPNALPFYDLTIDVEDDLRAFTLEQVAWVHNDSTQPWGSVVFRVFVNATRPDAMRLEALSCEGVRCDHEQPDPSAIVVRPASPVPPGGWLQVRLRLRGALQVVPAERLTLMGQGLESLGALSGGHGGGDYGLLAHGDGISSFASFVPVLARRRGGRWEQSDASTMGDLGTDALAHYQARVRVPDGTRVVATGVEDPPRVIGDRSEVRVRLALGRDFAFAASPRFEQRARQVGDVAVRSWFLRGHEASGVEALEAAAHSVGLFERRFGAYPYTELDVVEAPLIGGAGGVEFSSMVTVATMFYRPAGAGGPLAALMGGGQQLEGRRAAMLELVTAHEVAHQWWHGIVGSDSRRHPFQDETLAQWSALLYVRDRHGDARAEQERDQQVVAGYHMMRLMGRPDGAVDRPVSAFPDPLSYGGLVYGKGPLVYPAMRRQLGDRRFYRAVRAYADAHRFRIAPPRALFDRFARGRHAPAARALERRWLDEAHGDADLGPPSLPGLGPGAGDLHQGLGGADEAQLRRMLEGLLGGGGQAPDLRGLMEMLQGATP
ncbi:MAG: M1 family aminopeptidase [Myxococcota bacterium]|nr:M1 family aminopeptidase [Myxococcota bacterium]